MQASAGVRRAPASARKKRMKTMTLYQVLLACQYVSILLLWPGTSSWTGSPRGSLSPTRSMKKPRADPRFFAF